MENYHNLSDLYTCISGWHIRVKLLRVFTVRMLPSNALGVILMDDKGERIECRISSQFTPHYFNYLEEGNWVSIMNFRVWENSSEGRATNNPHKISFLESTIVKNVDPPLVEPCNKFIPFSSIIDGSADTSCLIDLLGYLFDVGEVENVRTNPNDIDGLRLSFSIRGMCGQVLNCMVKGRSALSFRDNYILSGGKPLICLFQMWRVHRWFDGGIEISTNSVSLPDLNGDGNTLVTNQVPGFDLNQISREEDEPEANGEHKVAEAMKNAMLESRISELHGERKLPICGDVEKELNIAVKRRVSWQDPVALSV